MSPLLCVQGCTPGIVPPMPAPPFKRNLPPKHSGRPSLHVGRFIGLPGNTLQVGYYAVAVGTVALSLSTTVAGSAVPSSTNTTTSFSPSATTPTSSIAEILVGIAAIIGAVAALVTALGTCWCSKKQDGAAGPGGPAPANHSNCVIHICGRGSNSATIDNSVASRANADAEAISESLDDRMEPAIRPRRRGRVRPQPSHAHTSDSSERDSPEMISSHSPGERWLRSVRRAAIRRAASRANQSDEPLFTVEYTRNNASPPNWPAMYVHGNYLYRARSSQPDQTKGLRLIRQAADDGHYSRAHHRMGQIFSDEKHWTNALFHLRAAASDGLHDAIHDLAIFYLSDAPKTMQRPVMGQALLRIVADLGHPQSQYDFGNLLGQQGDFDNGQRYLKLIKTNKMATSFTIEKAEKNLERLASQQRSQLTASEREEVRDLFSAHFPSISGSEDSSSDASADTQKKIAAKLRKVADIRRFEDLLAALSAGHPPNFCNGEREIIIKIIEDGFAGARALQIVGTVLEGHLLDLAPHEREVVCVLLKSNEKLKKALRD